MMEWFSFGLSPEQEKGYRQHYLASDIRRCTLVIAVMLVPVAALAYCDFQLLGAAPVFYEMAWVRLFLVVCSLLMIILLQGIKDFRTFDLLVFIWQLVLLSCYLVLDYSRLASYSLNLAIDVVCIFIVFMIIPYRFLYQVISGTYFAAGLLVVLLLSKVSSQWPVLVTAVLALALGYAFALLGCRQLHGWRRREFSALEQLGNIATRDDLTGVFNRRHFIELSEAEFARFKRYGHAFALVLVDLDRFNEVNKSHGLQVGDRMLQAVVSAIAANLRAVDVVGRMGGGEFAVAMPETREAEAVMAGGRILAQMHAIELVAGGGETVRITASIGVVEVRKSDASLDDLIKRANYAVYTAKRRGMDRVEPSLAIFPRPA